MSLPKPHLLAIATVTLIAAPAVGQDLTATLRIHGDVMVSTGGEFLDAVDGQPVAAEQRIVVAEGASATVQFSQDCKRTYGEAGVYTIAPIMCDEDERQGQQDEATEQGGELAAGGSPLSSVGILLGAVAAIPLVADQLEDDPASR